LDELGDVDDTVAVDIEHRALGERQQSEGDVYSSNQLTDADASVSVAVAHT
jgi:hypothetical protein